MRARVIIVNWNGRRWLHDCLASVTAQQVPDVEIVLVDNASTDDSVGLVRKDFPAVQVIGRDRNEGFARACNIGAAQSDADYLVFLNNDTIARPGWLRALIETAEREPGIGLVASQLVYMDRSSVIDSAGDGYLRCGGAFKMWHGRPAASAPGAREVFGVCGAAFLIRRELFERLGGFDERFQMVYEDVDLSFRARLLGARIFYAAEAIVEHAGSASLGPISRNAVFYGQRNLEWVWLSNMPRGLLWRSVAAHVAYDLSGMLAYARRGRLGSWVLGKLAAIAGIPAALSKRRRVQSAAIANASALWALMDANWTSIKRSEKEFDFARSDRANHLA